MDQSLDLETQVNTELKCEKCGKVYGNSRPEENGHGLVVKPGGVKIRVVNKNERVGALVCECGHETLIDLAVLGTP